MLAAALALAEKGFRVFPCIPKTKRPLVDKFTNRSTTNAEAIRRWWAKWPNANVGISLQGLLVIDVDGPVGERSLAQLRQMRSLPATAEARSGSGGRHLFYRLPTGVRAIPRTLDAKTLRHFTSLDKIDIKGSGGLVVGAGSVNKEGRPYAWATEPESVAAIAPAPAWVLEELCGNEKGEYLVQYTADMTVDPLAELVLVLTVRFPIAPGTRNEQTARAAAWMLGRNLTQEKAQEAGLAWLNAQGREDEDSHADLLRTLSKLYGKLAAGDESVYIMDDHEQLAVDHWQEQGTRGRTLNRFSVLPLCDYPETTENDRLFLTALECFIKYEVAEKGKKLDAMPMTYGQLRKVYKLLHGKSLPIDSLYKMLSRFVERPGEPAQKIEVLKQVVVGHIGKPSIYRVTHLPARESQQGCDVAAASEALPLPSPASPAPASPPRPSSPADATGRTGGPSVASATGCGTPGDDEDIGSESDWGREAMDRLLAIINDES